MFVYYVPGDRLKHVSPDLFVVRGVPKDKPRKKYLCWEEGKGPDLVVELTSGSTRDEDVTVGAAIHVAIGVPATRGCVGRCNPKRIAGCRWCAGE
jgi:Uma2 family endonuclease